MSVASFPKNEHARLQALAAYRLLDTSTEQRFDDIAQIASYICDVPIALVVLLDRHRQWFKARVGVDVQETPREYAFCAHAILQEGVMEVENALDDQRFADNPLVTGEPNIRFYAGAPLITPDGFKLGTLCVIDRRPRKLSSEQTEALAALSRQAMYLMESKKVSDQLAEALQEVKVVRELLPVCSWCKKIRDDNGYWERVEHYLQEHMGVDMTHGICPSCAEQFLKD